SSPPSGTSFNRDTTNTVIATATDACGNTNICSFLVMVRRPTLGIGVGSELRTNIIITWDDGGVLQHATNVTGPWENLPGATSPFTTNVLSARRFFRVCCP